MLSKHWCWPWLHTWSKWSEVKKGVKTKVYNPHYESWRREETEAWYYQERTCEVCGLYKQRTV